MDTSTIEFLANLPLPAWAIPYSLLCLLLVIFGLCTVVSSSTVKKLRSLEQESKQNIKELERQHERDSILNMELKLQIDRLRELSAEDENNLPNPP